MGADVTSASQAMGERPAACDAPLPEGCPTTPGFYGQPLAVPPRPETQEFFRTKKGKPLACPQPAGPVADSHTHLTSLRETHPAVALARAALAGLTFVVTVVDPADDARDAEDVLRMLADWQAQARFVLDAWGAREQAVPRVRLLAGVHPHNASALDAETSSALCRLLADPICSGMGEIGLDYHYDLSPRDVQKSVFERQLALAVELDMPLSLHVREAHDDAYEIMSRVGLPASGAVLHCFDLGSEEMHRFCALGCHLGIGGAVTFVSCEATREAMRACPAERIVTETDAPYMAPVPLRGTPCEPACTAVTADFLACMRAEARGEDVTWQYETFAANARALFDTHAGFRVPEGAL